MDLGDDFRSSADGRGACCVEHGRVSASTLGSQIASGVRVCYMGLLPGKLKSLLSLQDPVQN